MNAPTHLPDGVVGKINPPPDISTLTFVVVMKGSVLMTTTVIPNPELICKKVANLAQLYPGTGVKIYILKAVQEATVTVPKPLEPVVTLTDLKTPV